MLYYRLLAIYSHLSEAPEPDLPVFMKSTNPAESLWYTELKDKDAGLIVRIGDCRGAAAVWVAALDLAAGTVLATAKEHLEDLLALICSPRCPHTYDGTVAGCVA